MERKVKELKIDGKFEVKQIEGFELKSIDSEGRFCGYASVFNIEDSYKDIIVPNAFKRTLERKSGVEKDIKLLWQHCPDEPIGTFDVIHEDSIGLYVEGKVLLSTEKGREAYSLIKSGAVSGLSIGYSVKSADINSESGIRTISDIDLLEISIVTFPANKHANITYVKTYNPVYETKEFRALDRALRKAIKVLRN